MQDYNFYAHPIPPYFPSASHPPNQPIIQEIRLAINFIEKSQLFKRIQLLQHKCKALQLQNHELKRQVEANSPHVQKTESTELKEGEYKIQNDDNQDNLYAPKMIKKRRSGKELVKNFKCPYPDCERRYGCQLALNLHMKQKHNGGTKIERRRLLQEIIEAERKGTNIPEIHLTFPPNYIAEKKKLLLNCQQANVKSEQTF